MENQNGRSMIEMLGVLAIVGVLSVGGIAGYSKAMTKYNVNKLVEEYLLFLQNIQMNHSKLCKISGGGYVSLLKYLKVLDIVPNNWEYKKENLYDSLGYRLAAYAANTTTIELDYYLKNSEKTLFSKRDEKLCTEIWNNLIIPYVGTLYKIEMRNSGTITARYYGENYCNEEKYMRCISSVTVSNIIDMCERCTDDYCMIVMWLK